MSEYFTGLLVVFSQLGVVLVVIAIAALVYMVIRKNKDNSLAKLFVGKLKQNEGGRKDKLTDVLKKVHEMDENLADKTAESMLMCEKKIYNRALKLFLGHDRDSLNSLQSDVENMAGAYRKLIASTENVEVIERGGNPKVEAQLRAAAKLVTAERDKIQKDLDEAMLSMENMLKEYTQMYSGGGAKKEGVKHIENELTMLKQKIDNNVVVVDDDLDLGEGTSEGTSEGAPGGTSEDTDDVQDLSASKD